MRWAERGVEVDNSPSTARRRPTPGVIDATRAAWPATGDCWFVDERIPGRPPLTDLDRVIDSTVRSSTS
jgi:hypothetical protein